MIQIFSSNCRDRCRNNRPAPFPAHALSRADRPTTESKGDVVQEVDERGHGFKRIARGLRPHVPAEFLGTVTKLTFKGEY